MLNSGNCFFTTLWFCIRSLYSRSFKSGRAFLCPGCALHGLLPGKHDLAWPCAEPQAMTSRFVVSLPLKCCILIRMEVVKWEKEGRGWDSGMEHCSWGRSTAWPVMLAGLPSRDFHRCT